MNKAEAKILLDQHLEDYRKRAYDALVPLVGQDSQTEIDGPSGVRYQVEVELFWDDKPGGMIRVVASIDDGGLRAFVPLTQSLLVRPGSLP
jgi:hypothetical protein